MMRKVKLIKNFAVRAFTSVLCLMGALQLVDKIRNIQSEAGFEAQGDFSPQDLLVDPKQQPIDIVAPN